MKKSLHFALCIATVGFLTVVPAELLAHHSGDPKLDRAVEKANSEFVVAMKTGDAATIAAPYTDDASFITIDGACVHGRTEIEKMYRDRFARAGLAHSTKITSKKLVVDNDFAYESRYGNRIAERWQAIDQRRPVSHRLAAPDERRLEDFAKCRAAVKRAIPNRHDFFKRSEQISSSVLSSRPFPCP